MSLSLGQRSACICPRRLAMPGNWSALFGRPAIARLPLPDGRSARSGRRYFVFADLAAGDSVQLAAQVATAAGKALVLATSTEAAMNDCR